MKQTAVEWLIEQIIKYRLVTEGTNPDNVLFHKAKEMEKEQIIEAYHKSALNEATHIVAGTSHISAEQYYNQTYGKNAAE